MLVYSGIRLLLPSPRLEDHYSSIFIQARAAARLWRLREHRYFPSFGRIRGRIFQGSAPQIHVARRATPWLSRVAWLATPRFAVFFYSRRAAVPLFGFCRVGGR